MVEKRRLTLFVAVLIAALGSACGSSSSSRATGSSLAPDVTKQASSWVSDKGFAGDFGFATGMTTAMFHGRLYVAAVSSANQLVVESTADGATWTPCTIKGQTGSLSIAQAPVLAATSSVLLLAISSDAFAGSTTSGGQLLLSSDGSTFVSGGTLGFRPQGSSWMRSSPQAGTGTTEGAVMIGVGTWFTSQSTVYQGFGYDGWTISSSGTATPIPLGGIESSSDAIGGQIDVKGAVLATVGKRVLLMGAMDFSGQYKGPFEPTAWISDDGGVTWKRSARGTFASPAPANTDSYISAVATSGSSVVAVGNALTSSGGRYAVLPPAPTYQQALVWHSNDGGNTWTRAVALPAAGMTRAAAVALAGSTYVAVGESSVAGGKPTPLVWTSSDGINWTPVDHLSGLGVGATSLFDLGGKLVAIGADPTGDAAAWTAG